MVHYTDAPEDNLLGLTNRHLLDEAEAEGVIRAENFLYDLPEDTEFTMALLLNLHRAVFEHVYEWADQYRRPTPTWATSCRPRFSRCPRCSTNSQRKFVIGSNYWAAKPI